jgi:hypothetical protein
MFGYSGRVAVPENKQPAFDPFPVVTVKPSAAPGSAIDVVSTDPRFGCQVKRKGKVVFRSRREALEGVMDRRTAKKAALQSAIPSQDPRLTVLPGPAFETRLDVLDNPPPPSKKAIEAFSRARWPRK